MPVGSYVRPSTIEEAVTALRDADGAGVPLAGGTDLLVQAKVGRDVGTVVDLKRLEEVMAIDRDGAYWRIGAGVPAFRIGRHEALRANLPGLVEGVELIGSTQIQGRATLGGNVGNASPAADAVPALLVNDALVHVAGPTGRRDVPLVDLITGPGRTGLEVGEFIVAFVVPVAVPGQSDAAMRFIPRTEMDIAVANVAVGLRFEGTAIAAAGVAIGAVGPRAIRVPDAEAVLEGQAEPSDDVIRGVVAACRAAAAPITDRRGTAEFREHAIGVLAARACRLAAHRARAHGAGQGWAHGAGQD